MSIIITNITPKDQTEGPDRYVLCVNEQVICKFDHESNLDGLPQCLRDAADAVDVARENQFTEMLMEFQELPRADD